MIIPKIGFKRKIGEKLDSFGVTKVKGTEGGLPNLDDGYFVGMPLGGIGAGTFAQTYRGDFSIWHLEVGKHVYKTLDACQFGIFENGEAFILNDLKPSSRTLSSWKFKKQNGTYHALYPRAYFHYEDLNIIQEQFSPIIPHNYKETSYPVAVFKWHIFNPTDKKRELSLLWTWESFFGSSENTIFRQKGLSGIVFSNLNKNTGSKYGQMGMFVGTKDTNEVYFDMFNPTGDGSEIWEQFSKDGTLNLTPNPSLLTPHPSLLTPHPSLLTPNLCGAISAKVRLQPNENRTITFVLAWDYPIIEFGSGTKWFKRYMKFFGNSGNNVVQIAEEAVKNNDKWLSEIKIWQEEYLKLDKPDWFKTFLLNELYYIAHGGTVWTTDEGQGTRDQGQVQVPSPRSLVQKEHFGMLECFDYPFYETLDVRFYGSFPLLKLWPELEKLVLEDYCKSVDVEIKEEVFFDHPLIQNKGQRKLKGALPHDLGSPYEDPFFKINAYKHGDINKWKDLNSKFVLMIYRYFYLTGKKDIEFLKNSFDAIEQAINYLKKFDRDGDCLIENDNFPDQTYDNWVMHGPSTYCNGLWLAALASLIEIAKVLGKNSKPYEDSLIEGKKNLEEKLWNRNYYLYDMLSDYKNSIMADALCGQWYADLLGLGDIFNPKRANEMLNKIFSLNVMKVKDGNIGALNGINPDGSLLPDSKVWRLNTQCNEVWSGVTLGLSSLMELRGLKEEALKTTEGVYKVIYEDKGYWFRTPEAWDINGNFRASMYHRPGAIWAFTFHSAV